MRASTTCWAVGTAAVRVYLGALWNGFALDDAYIVLPNPVVQQPGRLWHAFTEAYWPSGSGGEAYRPLAVVSYALDRLVDGRAWFHAVNVMWHAAAAIVVTRLAWRWTTSYHRFQAAVTRQRDDSATADSLLVRVR